MCTRKGLQAVPVWRPDTGGGEGGVPLRRPASQNQFGARCLQRSKLISILLHKFVTLNVILNSQQLGNEQFGQALPFFMMVSFFLKLQIQYFLTFVLFLTNI